MPSAMDDLSKMSSAKDALNIQKPNFVGKKGQQVPLVRNLMTRKSSISLYPQSVGYEQP